MNGGLVRVLPIIVETIATETERLLWLLGRIAFAAWW
jgi:hypothetical protein